MWTVEFDNIAAKELRKLGRQVQKDRMKMELEKGMASFKAGRLIDGAEVIAELR